MYEDDRTRIRHMIDFARKAVEFMEGRSQHDLESDELLTLALTRAIEVVGEAAARITQGYRQAHPEIPWQQIIGMRNRLIHAYFDINLEVLWMTVKEDLPALIAQLEPLVPPSHH